MQDLNDHVAFWPNTLCITRFLKELITIATACQFSKDSCFRVWKFRDKTSLFIKSCK